MGKWMFAAAVLGLGAISVSWYMPADFHINTAMQHLVDSIQNTSSSQSTVYKVQKPDGRWEFTNQTPNTNERILDQQTYHSDTNIVPNTKEQTIPDNKSQITVSEEAAGKTIDTPYSKPQQITELINNAKNLQKVFSHRQDAINESIDGR